MLIGFSLLPGLLIVAFGALMLITQRASPTGGWSVIVIGFIVTIGKLYDHYHERRDTWINRNHQAEP